MPANSSKFKVKNGLTVGTTDVIAANGQWIGSSTGLIGSQGAQGYQGFNGSNGTGIVSSASAPANTSILWLDTSAPSTTGPQGPQGYQGYQGATGPQGSQGYQGYQGYQGSQGYQGYQGYQGSQGYQGYQGYQGITLTTSTNNGVVFVNGSGQITSNSSAFLMDNSNWNVAIGNSSAWSKLWIERAGINLANFSYEDSGSLSHLTLAGSDAHVRMHFGTMNVNPYGCYIQSTYDNTPDNTGTGSTGTEPLLFNPKGGQVIIGSITPFDTSTVPLYVKGGTSGWSVFERNTKKLYINANYSDQNTACQLTSESASNMALSLSARETLEDLYLTTAGLVGIGTNTPGGAKVSIKADWVSGYATVKVFPVTSFASGGLGGYGIFDSDGTTRKAYIAATSTDFQLWCQQNTPIVIGTNNTQRASITANGSWLVGNSPTQGYGAASGYMAGFHSGGSQTFISIAKSGQTLDTDGMILGMDGTGGSIYVRPDQPLDFYTNNTHRVRITNGGHLCPSASATYDLGTTSLAWRNIYTNDLHLSNESRETGNDIDGTKGNWTIQEGEDCLYIKNNKNGKRYKFSLEEIV